LSAACTKCGAALPAGARFCMNCGQPVGASISADEARLARLAAATPSPLAEKMRAAHLEGERKTVTVLFADVVGSTALAAQMDPEDWTVIMNRAFERLAPPIYQHEGTIARLMGDAILAFFGAPVAHEDDPARAIHAALDLLASARAYADEVRRERGISFAVRVGINTGPVVVGEVGSDLKYEYTAMGDAVNLAARMQSAADPDTVLITEYTHRLAAPFFAFEDRGKLTLRGKAEPVHAYRVIGERTGPVQPRGIKGLRSPLVGRDAELAVVNACMERLRQGQGGILAILGEAGLGKSRLMAEVRQSLIADGLLLMADSLLPVADRVSLAVGAISNVPSATGYLPSAIGWFEGRTLSFGHTISYWPFREILRQWSGIGEDDAELEAWSKLERKTSEVFETSEVSEVLPYLASLLALEVKGDLAGRVKYLDGEAMGRQIFLTSHRFFERLAQTRPTVLVFEDLHWVDESSAQLLEHLLPLARRVPLLICGLSRPDPNTPAARLWEIAAREHADRYTEIGLLSLSHGDSAQLVRNLLAMDNLPARVREMIQRRAEGNPFFLEEVVRALVDSRAMVRDATSGRWQATAQLDAITIPDTIQGVIIARVDQLAEDVKQVLRTAAVIGRSFLYRVLKAVAQADRELDRHLAELQQVELIREKRIAPEVEYIFKHALAQEATYESILLHKRRELHARVGQTIEALFADRLEGFYGLLAYHYARADAWDKAQAYLLKAGDQAGSLAADAEALASYQQAMAAYARAFGDRWQPLQRATLERKMGEALFRRGEHTQARECAERALAYLERRLPASRWEVRWAIVREAAVQIGHRLWPGLVLRNASRPVRPEVEEEIRLYYLVGWTEVFEHSERLLLLALKGLNVAERSGFAYGIVLGASGLGLVADIISRFRLAEYFHRQAVALAEQLQHPAALGFAYQNLTVHEFALGNGDAVLEYGGRAAEIFHDTGDLHAWGSIVRFTAYVLEKRGEFTRVLNVAQDLVHIGQAAADAQVWCLGESRRGSVWRRMGRFEDAIASLLKAIELAEAIPDHSTRVESGGELARCYLRLSRLTEALAALAMSEQVVIRQGLRSGPLAWVHICLAEAYLHAAEQSGAQERAAWLKKARQTCRAALKQVRAIRPLLPEALRLQGTYEWLSGRPAAANKWWQRSLAEAEAMGHRHDAGLAHLEMGRRLGGRTHLERAEAVFAEIGAAWDLAKAQELLDG